MLQRNVSGYPLILPTLDPPVEIPNGGEFDFDEPLAGFEPVRPERVVEPGPAPDEAVPNEAVPETAPAEPTPAEPTPAELEQAPADETSARRSRRGTEQQKDASTEGA